MTDPLPPLGLDDLRVAEPDRDSEATLNPSETWAQACDAIAAGHKPADVAALLLSMDLVDTSQLWQWWGDEVREAAFHSATWEADCPNVLLLAALNRRDVRDWRFPAVSGASVVALLDERDRLQAAATEAHAILFILRTALRTDPDRQAAADRALVILTDAMRGDDLL